MSGLQMNTRRLLLCSYYMPQADLDSYSRRLFHFVEFLREAGWSVTCVASNPKGTPECATLLEEKGIAVHVGLEEHVERLASAETFDVALLGFWHIAGPAMKVLRRRSPATRLIVDSGDLHFLRRTRKILWESAPCGDVDLDPHYAWETISELAVYAAADAVLAVSRKEARMIGDFLCDPTRAFAVPDCEDLPLSPVPFDERRGMLFVGNYQHPPNVEAVEFLCKEILPQFDPALLAEHPVDIVGSHMTDAVRKYGEGLPGARMVGWIPSVVPYLERVRVSLVPLLNGAGTKRKMIQALAIGTPTVATRIGAEGFDLSSEEHVLIADDPFEFANAAARLLQDAELWERLALQGRGYMLAEHALARGRHCLMEAIAAVLARPPRQAVIRARAARPGKLSYREYLQIVQRTRETVCQVVPSQSTVLVVSKGDDALLDFGDRIAWHYPQHLDGRYAGYYPGNSAEAILHLEEQLGRGADFLVFPRTAFWWLEHYADLRHHLEARYRLVTRDPTTCLIFWLREPPAPGGAQAGQALVLPESAGETAPEAPPVLAPRSEPASPLWRRPVALEISVPGIAGETLASIKVLVIGAYLADSLNNIDDIVLSLSQSTTCAVSQRWAALGGGPPTAAVARVTTHQLPQRRPKLEILNELLRQEDLGDFDYVLVCDDDIALPEGFLDRLVALQSDLGLVVAQPALTPTSIIHQTIVEQQRGVAARETRVVATGPVVSFHRSVFSRLFPFNLTTLAGWGNGLLCASDLLLGGERMGIVDAVPVEHGVRALTGLGSGDKAAHQLEYSSALPAARAAEDSFRVIGVAACAGTNGKSQLRMQRISWPKMDPCLSVVIPTHNRAPLLEAALASLASQSLSPSKFEVIVVDDGSTDATPEVCERWSSRLPLNRMGIRQSGIAAAKNLGVFAARGPIVLYFDDDDLADENLLAEHLKTHARYPLDNVAVLGYTDWAPTLAVTDVMHFVTDIGHYLFSYTNLRDGQRLDFAYFWGGRTSCKKSLITRFGVFRQEFEFGSEDIELGFRISKRLLEQRLLHRSFEVDKNDEDLKQSLASIGLVVVYNRAAIQHMNRAITYDAFCRRCERQGKSQWQFSRLHKDSLVHEWCQTDDAMDRWSQLRDALPANVARVHELERMLAGGVGEDERRAVLPELHKLYWWTFNAFKTKGIAEAMVAEAQPPTGYPDSAKTLASHEHDRALLPI
jgi:glycosyltransferase involved in cell wall biosynthesis